MVNQNDTEAKILHISYVRGEDIALYVPKIAESLKNILIL